MIEERDTELEMNNNLVGNEGEDHHHHHHQSIEVWEVKRERLAIMQEMISAAPKILCRSAGRSSCCIFRVPQTLIDINGLSYQPHIVSIGPYHHGEPQLQMIQEHKWRFLGSLLKRVQNKGLGLEDLLKAVQPLEMRARDCYSQALHISSDEFIEMLVLDGCFIIELFRRLGGIVPFEADDPLINMSWIYSFFLRDLIRLENQIPFFILERLFDLTNTSLIMGMGGREPSQSQSQLMSLPTLTLKFFNNALPRSDEVISRYSSNHQGKHLLDFLRSSFIPPEPGFDEPDVPDTHSHTRLIQCISSLRRAGINLKTSQEDSFLAVKFRRGVIEMPTVALDDFMSSFLLNCVAYEQCHGSCSKHITTYATLLDCLINSARDVEFLSDRCIIENYFGTHTEVARFINNLGKDVSFDIDRCYLSGLFNEVNQYYSSNWHINWASFKYTYFSTPWSFISALAAFVLLVLTILQTLYTILGYGRPPS